MMKALITVLLIALGYTAIGQNDLMVKIEGIEKIKGQLEICVYEAGNGFMNSSKALECVWIKVNSKQASYIFKDLKPGKYAVIVIQDLNNNKSLDTNFFRIPNEPYGFSTNPSTTFGPPDFDGASFTIKNDLEISIELK